MTLPLTKKQEDYIKDLAYGCFRRRCPTAPPMDRSQKPPVPWPAEKSTTQQGFIEGYMQAILDMENKNDKND